MKLLKTDSQPPPSSFITLDKVFGGTNNAEIYEYGIQKLVRSTMEGYNGTVFAYGQTASGKTYTMIGTNQEPGVIPKAVRDVFMYIEEEAVDREFLLQVSYMEIYNEKINDLLSSTHTTAGLSIRISNNGQDYVENLTTIPVTTPEEVMAFIKQGEGRRHTSETDFNENSSRSHTIFQLTIESKSRVSSFDSVRISRLNLIDLAGSEKVATNTERRQEGAFINKSLLTLGKVITHLNAGAKHIPYRDSKLTRILSASLSGNDRVAVICTINPTWKSKDESTNTLRFAQGVKKIEINPKITQINQRSSLRNYKEQIMQLETQMQKKTEQEAETKQRLSRLLSLILTSSKTPDASVNKLDDVGLDPGDYVKECEEHLSATINKHLDEINEKEQHLQQLDDRLSLSQQNLYEKTAEIDELHAAIDHYKRIIDNLQSDVDTYRLKLAHVNKRSDDMESTMNKRLVVAENRVKALEAQRQVQDQIKILMEQELDNCKAELEQRKEDIQLGMVESLYDVVEEHDDKMFGDIDGSCGLTNDQQLLADMEKRLLESDQQVQHYQHELDKECQQVIVYKMTIHQMQARLDKVEAALEKATLGQESGDRKIQLSTETLPPTFATTVYATSNMTLTCFLLRHLYFDQCAFVLLLTFGLYLFL
ncbi:P-loop containing nucleoside triphosphate hydrolase protein [Chlamydoabsidia padenii]|nr:P-loop containing nucleoside triphosphate hydrolase protein [Chlamydoabsidia padenii]